MAARKATRTSSSTRADPQVLGGDDDQAVRRRRRLLQERDVDRVRVARIGTGDERHDEADVGDGTGHRADGDERLPGLRGRFARHGPEGRLEADDTAERGRDADGPATVTAHGDRPDTGCDRRPGATRRSARGARQVPRIGGPAVDRRFGDARVAELGHGGLGEDHGAGLLEALQDDRRAIRDESPHRQRPVGTLHAGQPLRVLGADREPGKRTGGAAGELGVGGVRGMQGPLVQVHGERIDGLADRLRPCQDRVQGFDGRELAVLQGGREVDRGQFPRFHRARV